MTSWLNETAFVQNLAQDMLTPRRNFYQEDYISTYHPYSRRVQDHWEL